MESSSLKLSKCKMIMDVYSGDRISELPDEVLEDILSRLSLRDAVVTSSLARRWKNLWTYSTGNFDFDFGVAALTRMKKKRVFSCLTTERTRYIERVDNILRSHKGLTMDAFKITFDLRSHHANHINTWIQFAMRKKVRNFELDLRQVNPKSIWQHVYLTDSEIMHCYTFPSLDSINLRLTSLKLNYVNVSRETVEFILFNCPVLEDVSIIKSPSLSGVRVADACPKLKRLEIAHCQYLEILDISSAPNLRFFSYTGPNNTRLCLRDVPYLVHVSLQGGYCDLIIQKFHELHLPLFQILKLELSLSIILSSRFNRLPELKSVTELKLEFKADDEYCLLSCAYAIEACVNLHSLWVQLNWVRPSKLVAAKRRIPEPELAEGTSYKCLKEVELSGFRGSQTDIELSKHILSTAPYLEKITVNTIHPDYVIGTTCSNVGENLHAKKFAKHIASRFCPAARLLIR